MKENKNFKILRNLSFTLLIALVAFLPLAFTNSPSYFEISKNLDIFATLYKELNSYYVDEVEPSKLIRKGIDAMLTSLDPYTSFISEAEMENYRLQTTGKYGGIGALIRKIDDYVVIAEPYQGYPADKYGMMAGDMIIEVEGKSAKGKNTEEVSKMLKGQAGTKVKVKISRLQANGSQKEIDLEVTREEIKIQNVPFYGMVNENIGYIRLSNFTEKAGKEVRDAYEELKLNENLQGIVFDLRGNPGGLLNEAVNVSNVFIPKNQEIVSTKGKIKEWDKTFKTLNAAVDDKTPLIVLTNKGSASASEIVSGSIQDLDRGLVIGQKTFGKGLVQTTRSLTYNTKLKVTTAKYYIPSGRCIQAINYAERDEDGSVAKIPDSLKIPFKTASGREVYDGGGIDPDIVLEPTKLSMISYSLLSRNLIFNFATHYRSKHEKIAAPLDFKFTEKDYQDFIDFISDKDYDYTTKSEDLLKEFEEAAQKEKYYEGIKSDFETLKASVKHDKNKDIEKHREEITELLQEEIVGRYYYLHGRIQAGFSKDTELQKAIEILTNKTEYQALLEPPK